MPDRARPVTLTFGDRVPPLFSTTAIAQLRGINRAALTSTATIARPTRAASPGGGANTGARTWVTIDDGEDVPCRLAILSQQGAVIVQQAGQPTSPDRMAAVFDLEGPEIKQGDRITVTGTDAAGGNWTRAVLVLTARNPRTYSAMRVFVCQDVPPGST